MKVLIIDDDPLVCQALKTILEANPDLEVVGVGYDGQQAIALFSKLQPDVLLMDIRMKGTSGLTACQEILRHHPQARILFLTTFSDDEYILQALKLGAKGYILKQDFEGIVPALKAVHRGQSVFGEAIITKLPTLLKEDRPRDLRQFDITEREQRIIELVAQGLSNKEIAQTLHLSEGTVRNYLSTILEKLGLRDRTQLAVFFLTGK
ncbi:MAG TPA: response regulator transcription factor [Firmicutes bacterium]|nr:response regulator transcription factor [Bacillota bacterium]